MKPELSATAVKEIENIAETILRLKTLDSGACSAQNYHELAVWKIREALEAAYLAGMVDRMK